MYGLTKICIMASALIYCGGANAQQPKPKKPDEKQVAQEAAWKKVQARLGEARKKLYKAEDNAAKDVETFFKNARGKASDLAEELVSLQGKWIYITSSGEEYKAHLKERYEAIIMKPDGLEKALQKATQTYLKELAAIENEFLVAVQADIEQSGLPKIDRDSLLGRDSFTKHFLETSKKVEKRLAENLRETIAQEAVAIGLSEVAARLSARIAVAAAARLGVSAGILGTAASSGVATLGAGLVIGIAVDKLLDLILKEFGHDPAAEIAVQIRTGLDSLESAVIRSDEETARMLDKLLALINDDADSDVRYAAWRAMSLIMSGRAGFHLSLCSLRNNRTLLLEAALERLIFNTSTIEEQEEKLNKEWSPLLGLSYEKAEQKARELQLAGPQLNAKSVLAGSESKDPAVRIKAVKAAYLFITLKGGKK